MGISSGVTLPGNPCGVGGVLLAEGVKALVTSLATGRLVTRVPETAAISACRAIGVIALIRPPGPGWAR